MLLVTCSKRLSRNGNSKKHHVFKVMGECTIQIYSPLNIPLVLYSIEACSIWISIRIQTNNNRIRDKNTCLLLWKPEDWSCVPKTCLNVEGEDWLNKDVLWPLHVVHGTCALSHTSLSLSHMILQIMKVLSLADLYF